MPTCLGFDWFNTSTIRERPVWCAGFEISEKKVAHEERFLAQFEGTITCGYFMKILTDLKTGACANVQVVVGLCAFRNHFNVHVW